MTRIIINELDIAFAEFLKPLHTMEGFDEQKFERLCYVLKDCQKEWENFESIPKLAVKILLNMYPAIEMRSNWYNEEDASRIRKAAWKIVSLIGGITAFNEAGDSRHVDS
jgi:HEPN domain-containing protein